VLDNPIGYRINVVSALLNNTLFNDEKEGFVESTTMLAKLEQLKNAFVPIVVTLFGIVMLAKLEQFWNICMLIVVNELFVGKVTLAKLEHPLNTPVPIVVTLFDKVMLAKVVQLWNALVPILVTLFGIVMLAKL